MHLWQVVFQIEGLINKRLGRITARGTNNNLLGQTGNCAMPIYQFFQVIVDAA